MADETMEGMKTIIVRITKFKTRASEMPAKGHKDISEIDEFIEEMNRVETRAVLEREEPKPVEQTPAQAVAKLAELLAQDKIDLETYQASLVAIRQKDEKEADSGANLSYVV